MKGTPALGRDSSLASVVAVGPVAAGALVWCAGRDLQLTLIVKARFGFEPDQTMRVLSPSAIAERDVYVAGDESRSLLAASETVPFRPEVDVTLVGHAKAPRGQVAQALAVRLALVREGNTRLDKVVHVYGDRRAATSAPTPTGLSSKVAPP